MTAKAKSPTIAASTKDESMPNSASPRGGSIGAASAGRDTMAAAVDVLAAEERVALTEEAGCGSWPPPVGAVLIGVRRGGFCGISATAEFWAAVAKWVASEGTALTGVAPEVLGAVAVDVTDAVELLVAVALAWKVPDGVTDGVRSLG